MFLCHSRESGNLYQAIFWIPAFAGMTVKGYFVIHGLYLDYLSTTDEPTKDWSKLDQIKGLLAGRKKIDPLENSE